MIEPEAPVHQERDAVEVTLHIRCSPADIERLRKLSDSYEIPVAALARIAIRSGLQRADRDPEGFFRSGRMRAAKASEDQPDSTTRGGRKGQRSVAKRQGPALPQRPPNDADEVSASLSTPTDA